MLSPKGQKPPKRFLGPATAVPHKQCAYMFGGVYTQVMNNFDQLSWNTNMFDVFKLVKEESRKTERPEQPVS